jgi:hypothetical protein
VALKAASEDGAPCGQASPPQNTELSEEQGPKDKTAEYCGIMKEINFLMGNAKNTAPEFVMPLKADCDITVPNDRGVGGRLLNDTFVA